VTPASQSARCSSVGLTSAMLGAALSYG
jgi:hypothetical protein